MENVEADFIGCIRKKKKKKKKKKGVLTSVTHIFPEVADEDFYTSMTCKQLDYE